MQTPLHIPSNAPAALLIKPTLTSLTKRSTNLPKRMANNKTDTKITKKEISRAELPLRPIISANQLERRTANILPIMTPISDATSNINPRL